VLPVSARTGFALKEQALQRAGGVGGAVGLGADLQAHATNERERASAAHWEALEAHVLAVLQSDERAAAKLESPRRVAAALLGKYVKQQRAAMELVEGDLEVIDEARVRLGVWEAETKGDLDANRARVKVVMHALAQRGQDFLHDEVTIWQLPRLLNKDAFVERFQQRVVADANATLQRTLEEVAAWMENRGASLARGTLELLTSRLKQLPDTPPNQETAYQTQRHALVLELHKAGATTMERYDPKSAAARMATATQTSIAQAALLQAGAAGMTGMVAVKAAALTDLTGLIPAALLLATGFGVLPMQRLRLQREYRQTIEDLTASLDQAVQAHMLQELSASKAKCLGLVSPFATLVKTAHAQQTKQMEALDESRVALSGLAQEVKASVARGGAP
jgi:hypothetical protein